MLTSSLLLLGWPGHPPPRFLAPLGTLVNLLHQLEISVRRLVRGERRLSLLCLLGPFHSIFLEDG
jgi:hypothetical protein